MNKRLLSLLLFFCFVSLAPRAAFAFGVSEKEQMREDVREALNRARDFNAQKVREATEDLERQRGAKAVKKQRSEFEAEQEKLREDFVTVRNARPSEFLEQARLERKFDEKRLVEDRDVEKSRESYVRLHRKVQHIIDTRAHIDEEEEYGL